MLLPYQEPVFSQQDQLIFDSLVHFDHWTRMADSDNEARLVARVEHLRDILVWVEDLKPLPNAETSSAWQTLQEAIEIARKVLQGHDGPKKAKEDP